MKHLSGLDATFLHIESPEMPMHVGSLNVLRLPEGYQGDFFEDVKTYIAGRLHLADVFTRKLVLMPFDLSNPVWVEDEDIDLDYHIRHITLPQPGTNRQLQQYVARLHSSLLDRSRPLWEFSIIDGLKSGEVALYAKVHHAGVDGQAGIALAQAIYDLTPEGRTIRKPRPRARRNEYHLGIAELATAALKNSLLQYGKLIKMAPSIYRAAKDALIPQKDEHGQRHWNLPKSLNIFSPRTVFNTAITNQRAFAGRTVPLAEVKQIAKLTGVSLNDVVMATVAGAVSKYLKELDDLPAKPLSAAVPISLREAGDTTANNQVSMITMTLATDIKDPIERLQKIHAASTSTKEMVGRFKAVIPTDFPLFGAPWLISGAASLYGRSRLANVVPPLANVVVSNVPGPNVPLYFAGAELTSYYPVSIPAHGMALNVTVQSYNGRLDYGLIACRRAVPDVSDIGDFIVAEHKKLLELALAYQAPVSAPASPPAEALAPAATAKPARQARQRAKPQLKLVAETPATALPVRIRKTRRAAAAAAR